MSLVLSLDALQPTTLWANDAKSTAATDGGTVAAWDRYAGSLSTAALQTDNTKRPLYRANLGGSGHPAVEADGTNDIMTITHDAAMDASIYDLFIVATLLTSSGQLPLLHKWSTDGWTGEWGFVNTGQTLQCGQGYSAFSGLHWLQNTKVLCHLHLENNNSFAVTPKASRGNASGYTPTHNTSPIRIFGGVTGYFLKSALHEFRLYTGGETVDDCLSTYAELAKKWGLSALATVPSDGGGGTSQLINGGLVRGQVL